MSARSPTAVGSLDHAHRELGAAQMSWHGYMALGLGAGLTIILGVGLMALAFYSSRHGHDELAYGASDDQRSASSLQADP